VPVINIIVNYCSSSFKCCSSFITNYT